jgi:hypothetical protein
MRLIDADALKEYMGCADAVKYGNKTAEQQHNSYSTIMMYEVADYIEDMPTIDAEPVRHGRWVQGKWATYPDGYVCDRCSTGFAIPYSHCPNCGAKMDAREDATE